MSDQLVPPYEVEKLKQEVAKLKAENELFRRALSEIEAEKAIIAYNQLDSSLKIRALLQREV